MLVSKNQKEIENKIYTTQTLTNKVKDDRDKRSEKTKHKKIRRERRPEEHGTEARPDPKKTEIKDQKGQKTKEKEDAKQQDRTQTRKTKTPEKEDWKGQETRGQKGQETEYLLHKWSYWILIQIALFFKLKLSFILKFIFAAGLPQSFRFFCMCNATTLPLPVPEDTDDPSGRTPNAFTIIKCNEPSASGR